MSKRERTRASIVAAAWRLFDAGGSAGVRMQDVAEEAGVTRQTVYFHFDNRANLLVEVARHVDEVVERLPERAAPVWEAECGRQAVARFVDLVAGYYPAIADVVREIFGTRTADPDVDAAWRDRLESRKGACRRLVEWLDGDGDLAPGLDRDTATDLLATLTSYAMWEDLTGYQGWDRDHYVHHLHRTIARTMVRGTDV